MINSDEIFKKMSKKRQQRIVAKAENIIKGDLNLQALRQISQQSQKQMAKKLKVNQPTISKMEKRKDMLLSSLRSYAEALGGELVLMIKFPGKEPVKFK